MTSKEIEQNIDWLKSHYYALLKRVQDLETRQCPHRYIDAVGKPFGDVTKEPTGEGLG